MSSLFDTSVLLASLLRAHPHHERAMSVVDPVRSGQAEGFVAVHGLLELYAVLTRLRVSPRIGPEAAQRMIRDDLLATSEIVALTGREYRRLIDALADLSIAGGATYDALQAACARKAGVARLYTFKAAALRRVAPDLETMIVAP